MLPNDALANYRWVKARYLWPFSTTPSPNQPRVRITLCMCTEVRVPPDSLLLDDDFLTWFDDCSVLQAKKLRAQAPLLYEFYEVTHGKARPTTPSIINQKCVLCFLA